jgi:hypothetical protein
VAPGIFQDSEKCRPLAAEGTIAALFTIKLQAHARRFRRVSSV